MEKVRFFYLRNNKELLGFVARRQACLERRGGGDGDGG